MKTALVLGAGGFIGSHLVKRLKEEGFWVRGVDLKYPEFGKTAADDFIVGDLRNPYLVSQVMFAPKQQSLKDKENSFDEVYQLAADMGGAGYINTGDNDADVMHNSSLINLNVLNQAITQNIKRILYTSSACVYPEYNQIDSNNPKCNEHSVYPAQPDSEYGWEKLFSERLYLTFARNHNLEVRIARLHNIFGPYGTYKGGKEKAPAALCRKVIEAINEVEVWGDGEQTRSFLYIDECIEGIIMLMNSNIKEPINIGSEELISINNLTKLIINIEEKNLNIKNILGPIGVRGRISDNTLIKEKLGWAPSQPLSTGITETYNWIKKQIK
jgi:nucleoside-diphosphate-sugar epimerase